MQRKVRETLLLGLCLFLFCLFSSSLARAGVELDIVNSLRERGGFRCTEISRTDGIYCIGPDRVTFVVLPKNLERHQKNIFYAHGLLGVCRNGASGENFMKGYVNKLRRLGAVAVMPYRRSAGDTSFPFTNFINNFDRVLGTQNLNWDLVGHSAGGQFFATILSSSPVTSRVRNVLLLDAVYNLPRVSPLWRRVRAANPNLKLHLISSSTGQRSRVLVSELNRTQGGQSVQLDILQEPHCTIPRYFDWL